MTILALLLALVALVLFVLAAAGTRATADARHQVALVPLGLAFLTAALISQFCRFGGAVVGG